MADDGSGRRRPTLAMILVVALTIAVVVVGSLFWIKGSAESVSHASPAVLTTR